MGLQPYQMGTNAPVTVGDTQGRIADPQSVTYVTADDGTVSVFDTQYLEENGSVTEPPAEEDDSEAIPVSPASPTDATAPTTVDSTTSQTPPDTTTPTDPVADGSRQETN